MPKIPTRWQGNPSAEVNRKLYDDSAIAYNSAIITYDSIVVGNQSENEKKPTAWSED